MHDLSDRIALARAVPIADEIHRRRIPLRRIGAELVGACPVCGDGGKGNRSNRFAVHLRKNAWLCRRCGRGGGVVDLVMHLDGADFHEAVASLAGSQRPASTQRPAPMIQAATDFAAEQERKRLRALRWWGEAIPIAGTLAEQYLTGSKRDGGRGLTLPPDISPRVLRFHPDCPFGDDGTRYPCLLALYRRIEMRLFALHGQPVEAEPRAVMRTALTADGKKIGRMGYGPLGGAAIKLSDDADVTTGLVIGEGLETVLAGMVFGFAPAWALGSAGAIRTFPVLSGIEALTILAETGDGGANDRATRECFRRWTAAGREVFRVTSMIGGDTNDALTMIAAGDADHATEFDACQRRRA